MTIDAIISATRRGAGLFEMQSRGLIEVRGSDRVRWLDGMISGDVAALAAGGSGSGCYATMLTNRGAILADFHVACLDEVLLLETLRSELPRIQATLERYVIADDVTLVDRSQDHAVLGLEGPMAPAILEAALTSGVVPLPEQWSQAGVAGGDVLIGGFGFSGEAAFQLRLASADREAVEAALDEAAGRVGADAIVRGSAEALEVMRIEAGIPALGRELDDQVLPPEARLERAISKSKGCYVGQEIVARLRSRGQVNHLLVGLALETASLPAEGAELSAGGRKTGEITSATVSPSVGSIALGFVRREHAEPGTRVELEGGRGRVVELPFVPASPSPARDPNASTSEAAPGARPR